MSDECPKTGQSVKTIIRTMDSKKFNKWFAFVTFEGYDYSESGTTEAEAIEALVTLHPQLQQLLKS